MFRPEMNAYPIYLSGAGERRARKFFKENMRGWYDEQGCLSELESAIDSSWDGHNGHYELSSYFTFDHRPAVFDADAGDVVIDERETTND